MPNADEIVNIASRMAREDSGDFLTIDSQVKLEKMIINYKSDAIDEILKEVEDHIDTHGHCHGEEAITIIKSKIKHRRP